MTAAGAASGLPSERALVQMRRVLSARKLLTYQRITVGLTRKRLDDLGLPDVDPVKVREMDAVDQIDNMQRLGEKVAAEQVQMERVIQFFKAVNAPAKAVNAPARAGVVRT